LWQLCFLSIPLASALTVPQKVLAEGNDVSELMDDELMFNTTDISISSFDARSCDNWDPTTWDYDVAIVGGGPAGLAASMSLGRVARTSIMYDSNEYRNGKTRYMHDVLGQDGNLD
jgi:threonine dehydrogenase-like Zn-dependent dehydrogenase